MSLHTGTSSGTIRNTTACCHDSPPARHRSPAAHRHARSPHTLTVASPHRAQVTHAQLLFARALIHLVAGPRGPTQAPNEPANEHHGTQGEHHIHQQVTDRLGAQLHVASP